MTIRHEIRSIDAGHHSRRGQEVPIRVDELVRPDALVRSEPLMRPEPLIRPEPLLPPEPPTEPEIPVEVDWQPLAAGSSEQWREATRLAPVQSPAPRPSEESPPGELGTPYLPNQETARAIELWQSIQGEFVDDPRKSVAQAHELVDDLMQRIIDSFSEERAALERQWARGEDVSTEELRLCLQRYRAFFSRLLPSAAQCRVH